MIALETEFDPVARDGAVLKRERELVGQLVLRSLLRTPLASARGLLDDGDRAPRVVLEGRNASVVVKGLMVVLSRLLVHSCSTEKLPFTLPNAISKKFFATVAEIPLNSLLFEFQIKTTSIADRAEHETTW